jgi:hypothetical protein
VRPFWLHGEAVGNFGLADEDINGGITELLLEAF